MRGTAGFRTNSQPTRPKRQRTQTKCMSTRYDGRSISTLRVRNMCAQQSAALVRAPRGEASVNRAHGPNTVPRTAQRRFTVALRTRTFNPVRSVLLPATRRPGLQSAVCRLIRPISARYCGGLSFRIAERILVRRLESRSKEYRRGSSGRDRRNISMACWAKSSASVTPSQPIRGESVGVFGCGIR
jgi:hypothetical protein